jgi:8-oxo-dGTP pyrophosphatase MutT (NUDIX family)
MQCHNCGKRGHAFRNCHSPIRSCGIVLKDHAGERVLLLQRRHSIGYMDFLRGKFDPADYAYQLGLWNEMTPRERTALTSLPFDDLWADLWNGAVSHDQGADARAKLARVDWLRLGGDQGPGYPYPEWGFPKGRRDVLHESDLTAAQREFLEETNIPLDMIDFDVRTAPFEEHIEGSNGKRYVSVYFLFHGRADLAGVPLGITTDKQRDEVGDLRWVTYAEAAELVRPYHGRRLEIIAEVLKLK